MTKTKKTKKTRRELHNEKRMSRFEAAGINAVTARAITKAVATCEGRQDDACALCDHAIVWLFKLTLTLGSGEQAREVTIFPVGSQCITDWSEALPLDVRALVQGAVKVAEKDKRRMQREMREAKKSATIVARLRGDGDEDGAKLMELYLANREAADKSDPVKDIAAKVTRYGSFASDRQRSFFAGRLRAAVGSGRQATQAPAQAPQEAPQSPDEALAAKGLKLLQDGAEGAMRPHRAATLRDIAGKARWGLSDGQRRFLNDLVREAEDALGEADAGPAPVTVDISQQWETPF